MPTNKTPPSEIEQYVIDFVTKLRKERSLSQEDIASIIGVSRSYVNNVENPAISAKYNLNHINALADYFKLSPQDFLPSRAFPN